MLALSDRVVRGHAWHAWQQRITDLLWTMRVRITQTNLCREPPIAGSLIISPPTCFMRRTAHLRVGICGLSSDLQLG